MKTLLCASVAVSIATSSFATEISAAARDWYVEQKRIHRMGRIAVEQKDKEGLYVAQGLNFKQGHKLRAMQGALSERVMDHCDRYQLAVWSMIKAGDATEVMRADRTADECWAAISGK